MYTPAHFAAPTPDALNRMLRDHPLGTLVHQGPQGLDADHLPFLFDPQDGPLGTLSAHVARANPLWRTCADGAPVLVIFRGADGYVSPSWYPSKQDTHRHVPTWNYEAVHAHGKLKILDDERYVRGLVARLTRQHEAGEPTPWRIGDAPADFIDQLLRSIVGIRVEITALEGKSKLGQNRTVDDRLGAADRLAERGHHELARRMRNPDT